MSALPPPDAPFDQLVSSTRTGQGRYRAVFPDGWQQGRGAFGGLVVGAMLRAVEGHAGQSERTVRSVTAELFGPVLPGEAELQVETLRSGSGVSTLACRLVQGGEAQAHAVVVLGKQRAGDRDGEHLPRPAPPPWRSMETIDVEPPLAPDFARFFEWRTNGPFPFAGEGEPVAEGWIRPKHPGAARDAAYIAGCADAWWPAIYTLETTPRPMATIAFTLQLCSGLEGLDPQAPFFHRSRDVSVRDGYVAELRELWGEDGRFVALNLQTIAIIK